MPAKIVTRDANGKLILMGEHAVVYGEAAIALPFSAVSVSATVEEKGEALSVSCAFYEGLVHQMPKIWESLKHAIRFSLYRIGAETDPAIHITIKSSIPAERGVGSSAAVATAIARSLFAFYDKPLPPRHLWDIVQSSEKIAHGNPSGIDAATIGGSTPIYFTKEEGAKALDLDLEAYLVVADTGIMGDTHQAVSEVAKRFSDKPETTEIIAHLGAVTKEAKEAIANDHVSALGRCMTLAQKELQRLGISHPEIERLVTIAMESGSLGAKLTGGGLGGCIIALADSRELADRIANRLEEATNRRVWIESMKR